MPKGSANRTKGEIDPQDIRQQDEVFQTAIAIGAPSFGFNQDGTPCTVGVSTHPDTKYPRMLNVARAPVSRGFGEGYQPRQRPANAAAEDDET